MSAYWKPGERISSSKLNDSSAATSQIDYTGQGDFQRNGKNWSLSDVRASNIESFWVSVDSENAVNISIPGTSSTSQQYRTIYKYDWTEVRYDPYLGLWTKTGRGGSFETDPLVNFDPTQKIPLTPVETNNVYTDLPVVKSVKPVVRDPQTGQLFFFS